ncbi:hypothetical protein ASE91_13610 [Sphingomonas sp. Leaf62]|nr:hypothetical protein ASE91_13610 [Sphingomonas sp. Leaf62]
MESDNLEALADNLEATANTLLSDGGGDAPASTAATTEPESGWVYNSETDKMRGGTNKTATVSATEPINLDFPYGQSTPSLVVRQDAKYGFDIYVSANGQFLCRSYSDDTISVKFDDGPIREWACAEPESGSSEIVFITQGKRFLSQLRKAKEVTIEAPMYEAGRQQMTFRVSGLKWQ